MYFSFKIIFHVIFLDIYLQVSNEFEFLCLWKWSGTYIGCQRRSWCLQCHCRVWQISEGSLWPKPAELSQWNHLLVPQTCRVCSSQSFSRDKYFRTLFIANHSFIYSHCLDHLPIGETLFLPLKVPSKCRETSQFPIWNATAGLLHHLYGVII